jgi:hypothetical protein
MFGPLVSSVIVTLLSKTNWNQTHSNPAKTALATSYKLLFVHPRNNSS